MTAKRQASSPLPRWAVLSAPYLAAYVAIVLLLCAMGWRMVVPSALLQLLAQEHLRERLLEPLLYLHSQPPLFNLLLGLALKLEQAVALPAATTLLALHLAFGDRSWRRWRRCSTIWGFAPGCDT